jgi:hypothetical protein
MNQKMTDLARLAAAVLARGHCVKADFTKAYRRPSTF